MQFGDITVPDCLCVARFELILVTCVCVCASENWLRFPPFPFFLDPSLLSCTEGPGWLCSASV